MRPRHDRRGFSPTCSAADRCSRPGPVRGPRPPPWSPARRTAPRRLRARPGTRLAVLVGGVDVEHGVQLGVGPRPAGRRPAASASSSWRTVTLLEQVRGAHPLRLDQLLDPRREVGPVAGGHRLPVAARHTGSTTSGALRLIRRGCRVRSRGARRVTKAECRKGRSVEQTKATGAYSAAAASPTARPCIGPRPSSRVVIADQTCGSRAGSCLSRRHARRSPDRRPRGRRCP